MKTILRVALVGAALLLLAACEATPEERAKAAAILPPDCEIFEVGEFGSLRQLVVVRCSGRETATANTKWSIGKTTAYGAAVLIDR